MSISALMLLVAAAGLHAGWNLLLKRVGGSYAYLWWALALSGIICLPVLAFYGPLPGKVWPYLIASAIVEAVYYATLASAYQKEDFSLVYPIARGAAPALLAIWAILFLKERPSLPGIIGIVVIVLGLMIVGSSKLLTLRGLGIHNLSGLGLAGAVAVIISIYSAIDGAAVKLADAVPYTVIVFLLTAIFVTPIILRKYRWAEIWKVGQAHWLESAAIGVLSLLAYMLVLIVYSFARVSYAGAVREMSIVLGALAGWLWLKEPFGLVRVVGALLIFAGILIIIVGG
jgi:drug/metabolite transporter (DMT)-like permease